MFTISLRHQLKDTAVKVFEIVPPAVNTELGKDTTGESEQEYRGIPPSVVAAATAQKGRVMSRKVYSQKRSYIILMLYRKTLADFLNRELFVSAIRSSGYDLWPSLQL